MPEPPRLEVRDVTVRYGDRAVLDRVSVSVGAGTVLGVIGPNGAGKTTLVEAISGFVATSGGSVSIDGKAVDGLPPHRRAGMGLGRTFQTLALFEDLSVAENLGVAATDQGVVDALATEAGLRAAAARLPRELSHAQRAALAVARAAAAQPRVLLLDEPAAGLDEQQRRALGSRLRRLAASGTAVMVVEHDIGLVLEVCDEVAVLDRGEVVAHGPPARVMADESVRAAYLGGQDDVATRPTRRAPGAGGRPWALDVDGLDAGYDGVPVITDVTLEVGVGEVVALLGLNGAGKTTTLRAVSGTLPSTARRVRVGANELGRQPPHRRVHAGLAHVPQTRFAFATLTVEENLRLSPAGKAGVAVAMSHFPVLEEMRRRPVHTLSGGEQRMVALGRAMAWRPAALLVDELSAGLSPGVVAALVPQVRSLASEHGTGVVLVEQHPPLAMSVADRFYVMERGRITGRGERGDPVALWTRQPDDS